MLRDLNDAWGWIKKLHEKVDRLYAGAMLENSSITNGRMRFINGVLRLDTGARLELVGTLDGEGIFRWVGPWEFDSATGGRIAGDVDLAGDFDLTGKFESDNVRIEGGKIYVGAGGSQIVIDGATGTIVAGGLTIDPSGGGRVLFPGGAEVTGFTGGGAVMRDGSGAVVAGTGLVSVKLGSVGLQITGAGIQLTSLGTVAASTVGLPIGALHVSVTGILRRVVDG